MGFTLFITGRPGQIDGLKHTAREGEKRSGPPHRSCVSGRFDAIAVTDHPTCPSRWLPFRREDFGTGEFIPIFFAIINKYFLSLRTTRKKPDFSLNGVQDRNIRRDMSDLIASRVE
jgi:hypothetical protein